MPAAVVAQLQALALENKRLTDLVAHAQTTNDKLSAYGQQLVDAAQSISQHRDELQQRLQQHEETQLQQQLRLQEQDDKITKLQALNLSLAAAVRALRLQLRTASEEYNKKPNKSDDFKPHPFEAGSGVTAKEFNKKFRMSDDFKQHSPVVAQLLEKSVPAEEPV